MYYYLSFSCIITYPFYLLYTLFFIISHYTPTRVLGLHRNHIAKILFHYNYLQLFFNAVSIGKKPLIIPYLINC